jgi:hypothetical protein
MVATASPVTAPSRWCCLSVDLDAAQIELALIRHGRRSGSPVAAVLVGVQPRDPSCSDWPNLSPSAGHNAQVVTATARVTCRADGSFCMPSLTGI